MAATIVDQLGVVLPCPDCHNRVQLALGSDGRAVLIGDAQTAGGLFKLTDRHNLSRRPITHVFDEIKAALPVHGGGYELHVCADRPSLF